jgi:hypothetical protein
LIYFLTFKLLGYKGQNVKTWQTEISPYLKRLNLILADISEPPPHPVNIPFGALETMPSALQCIIHRVSTFYEWGAWSRTRESTEALVLLWDKGLLSPGATIARLLFEIWGATKCMSDTLSSFLESREIEKFEQKVNKIFEGVRSEVLMPWGTRASEKPFHVLDTIRALKPNFPQAMELYEDLCESSHANQPRFMEWWILGKSGDNWTNETVQKRGHELIDKTVKAVEESVSGIVKETTYGLKICGDLYNTLAQPAN